MPAALERKLKRQVAGKKISEERKDAYVYGTLRKTGWKPSREKKMEVLSSTLDSIIKFNKPTLLGPWQGSMKPESKIDQEQFPAGLSPAAALRLPFPQLMAFLNQRNILQQVFSEKLPKLVELNNRLDEINLAAPPHPNLQQVFPFRKVAAGAAIGIGAGVAGIGAYKFANRRYKKNQEIFGTPEDQDRRRRIRGIAMLTQRR